jgi:hypothetical protein
VIKRRKWSYITRGPVCAVFVNLAFLYVCGCACRCANAGDANLTRRAFFIAMEKLAWIRKCSSLSLSPRRVIRALNIMLGNN